VDAKEWLKGNFAAYRLRSRVTAADDGGFGETPYRSGAFGAPQARTEQALGAPR